MTQTDSPAPAAGYPSSTEPTAEKSANGHATPDAAAENGEQTAPESAETEDPQMVLVPTSAGPALVPMGALAELFGKQPHNLYTGAPTAGTVGQPPLVPWSVAAPQFVPMGWIGDLAGGAAQIAGGIVGGKTGQAISQGGNLFSQIFPWGTGAPAAPQQGAVVVQTANGPQIVPMGWVGDLVGGAAQIAGGIVGGNTGQAISQGGSLFSRFSPWNAGAPATAPQQGAVVVQTANGPQIVPMGWIGDLVNGAAQIAGGVVGGKTGQAISQGGSLVGKFLPWNNGAPAAAPQQQGAVVVQTANGPQIVPMSALGDFFSGLGQAGGDWLSGQTFGILDQIVQMMGTPAPAVAPQQQGALVVQTANGPQIVPMGAIGGLLGGAGGGALGGWIGGQFGDENLGSQIGSAAGSILGTIFPFF